MSFETTNLKKELIKAVNELGYKSPTPIQRKAIPVILKQRDLLGCAQTGTGKTAAFSLPILHLMKDKNIEKGKKKKIRALIVTPTRELAIQIGESFTEYGKYTPLKNSVVFGGVSQKNQTDRLQSGIDILTATPGRLLDLMNQKFINLKDIEYFVLDEADRMLDMGFINDVKKIISHLPKQRQSLFFSATMPPEITKLAGTILSNPVKIEITPEIPVVEKIKQGVYNVPKPKKSKLLIHLLKDPAVESALVFTRTKYGADKVTRILNRSNIHAEAIHGNKSQNARQRALSNLKAKKTRVLVATDIAARGIDIDELSHVINFEIPNIPETYIHRIGRTGRAGLGGTAISLCDEEEKAFLKDIKKLVSAPIPVFDNHPSLSEEKSEPQSRQKAKRELKPVPAKSQKKKRSNSQQKRKRKFGKEIWTNHD